MFKVEMTQELKQNIQFPSETTQISEQIVFDSELDTHCFGDFEKKGFSITKGQKFIVPIQEGTECFILDPYAGACMTLIASEIENNHIITESHGSFTKEVCWKLIG